MAGFAASAMPVTMTAPTITPDQRPRPHSLGQLFWAFTWLALQGFGGVLAVVQRELVERRRWITNDEFIEDWAAAQILPGPNVVNLSIMVGDRYFGLRGALVAVAGMLLLPMLLLLAVATLYAAFASHPMMAGALRGMGAVAAGLVISTALKLGLALKSNPLGLPRCSAIGALTFAAVALARWPLAWVVCGLGSAAVLMAWRRLR